MCGQSLGQLKKDQRWSFSTELQKFFSENYHYILLDQNIMKKNIMMIFYLHFGPRDVQRKVTI